DRGGRADTAFGATALGAGLLILLVLGLIVWAMVTRSWPVLRDAGIGFLTSDRWAPSDGSFGVLTMIHGTFVVSFLSLVLAVPVSIGIALFTTEVAPRRLRGAITLVIDLLAAVPSVVYGLWGVLLVAPTLAPFYRRIS